jgi:hypothetical protein
MIACRVLFIPKYMNEPSLSFCLFGARVQSVILPDGRVDLPLYPSMIHNAVSLHLPSRAGKSALVDRSFVSDSSKRPSISDVNISKFVSANLYHSFPTMTCSGFLRIELANFIVMRVREE